ncbi:MAG: alanine racemase [Spirochaetales bacterium]|nr:alanine racemase [Spirochaetales bacterium]
MKDEAKRYPRLSIDLGIIEENYRAINALCARSGIRLTGVVKGTGGRVPVARAMERGGCSSLASSRLKQLEALRSAGFGAPGGLPLGLLRVPGPSEIASAVELADWSLQSEVTALELTASAAMRAGRNHGVVLMADLGDLREGWFDLDELYDIALRVERSMPGLHLRGIGTNLGCYGSILPSPDNLGRLVGTARRIESAIGRHLDVVSGGATSTLPLLFAGGVPAGISELRIGEGALCVGDLPTFYRVEVPGVRRGAYTLSAEVVERRRKPSHPVGERFIDAFGNKPEYEDRGVRTRLLLAVGKRDFGSDGHLQPRDPRIHVIGSSSDHLIVEADEACDDLRYGSILDFDLLYGAMLFLSDDNPYVDVVYTGGVDGQAT